MTVSSYRQDVVPGDPSAMALSCELRDEHRKARSAEAEKVLADAQSVAAAEGVVLATVYVRERAPSEAILEVAGESGVDLIVMASHGRSGLKKLLLGSQTQAVVSSGTVPVLVVR